MFTTIKADQVLPPPLIVESEPSNQKPTSAPSTGPERSWDRIQFTRDWTDWNPLKAADRSADMSSTTLFFYLLQLLIGKIEAVYVDKWYLYLYKLPLSSYLLRPNYRTWILQIHLVFWILNLVKWPEESQTQSQIGVLPLLSFNRGIETETDRHSLGPSHTTTASLHWSSAHFKLPLTTCSSEEAASRGLRRIRPGETSTQDMSWFIYWSLIIKKWSKV